MLDKVNGLSYGKLQAEKNVYRTLANHPRLFVAWMQLGVYLLQRSSLDEREREMVILRTTALASGRYPYNQHVAIGRGVGLTNAEIAAASQVPPGGLGRRERILVELADALFRKNDIDDRLWALARAELSTVQLMDTIVICGFYGLVSAVLNVARTPLEPGSDHLPPCFIE